MFTPLGSWLKGLDDIEYENGEGSTDEKNPQKGSTFSITTNFKNNLGEVTFCTVEELFLGEDLHFSQPKDSNHPDVLRYVPEMPCLIQKIRKHELNLSY